MKTIKGGMFLAAFSMAAVPAISHAVMIEVTVENLAPANSVTFAPLRVGFHNGTYDAFNNGEAAMAPIISVAEGGSGSEWFPAFQAADPTATLGTVADGGPLLPGGTASVTFEIDPTVNRFFTFASMVVPSNDLFVGNDNPMQYELFDMNGDLNLFEIFQTAGQIWDAGSEVADPANAAFLVGGVNANRTEQNGVVSFDFSELDAYQGLETAAGYIFDNQLFADQNIYRISFAQAQVPEPGPLSLLALGGLLALYRRRALNPGAR